MKGISAFITAGGMLIVIAATAPLAAENVHLYGALIAEPCRIAPQGNELTVDFGTVLEKYLYLNQRTQGQLFNIELVDCDLSIGKSVTITINGIDSTNLPGYLALSHSSSASGIAIGFENAEGKFLPLNKTSNAYLLQTGASTLAVKAYVQVEPGALKNKAIGRGGFNSTVTFRLDYL